MLTSKKILGQNVNVKFFTVAPYLKVIFEMTVTKRAGNDTFRSWVSDSKEAEFEPPGLAKIVFFSDLQSYTLNYHSHRLILWAILDHFAPLPPQNLVTIHSPWNSVSIFFQNGAVYCLYPLPHLSLLILADQRKSKEMEEEDKEQKLQEKRSNRQLLSNHFWSL